MGAQQSLTFQSFHVRSIFAFAITEMLCSKKNVRKAFRNQKLIDKLWKGESGEQSLTNFSKPKPVFN